MTVRLCGMWAGAAVDASALKVGSSLSSPRVESEANKRRADRRKELDLGRKYMRPLLVGFELDAMQ